MSYCTAILLLLRDHCPVPHRLPSFSNGFVASELFENVDLTR